MMDEERNAIPYGNIMLARNAIRDVARLRRNMQFDGMPSCIRSVVRETDMQRRTFLGTTVLGATLMTVSAPAVQAANTEWDKTFALDDRVAHEKVRFTNRFGIELAADLYRPKNLTGKLPAIAVSGPFGAVKEQASGLYAQELAIRGFVTVAFDPSFTGESGGVARNVASPDITAEDFSAAVDYLSLRDDVDPEKIGSCGICGWGGLALNAAALVVLDTNLSAESIRYLGEHCTAPLFADPVSAAKAGKLEPILGRLHTLKPNRMEAELLSGVTVTDEASLYRAAATLLAAGLQRVFISLGVDGVLAADRERKIHLHNLPARMVNTTGCGDAFMAAVARAFLDGADLETAAKRGLAASAIAMESADTINPAMSLTAVAERIQ